MNRKYNKAEVLSNPLATSRAVIIDEDTCIGCNQCVNACRMSLLLPYPVEGESPRVMYPDECWFCGVCVGVCPTGALRMEHPLNQCVGWKRKETGEFFRVGMKNPPSPNTRPPVG